jgi:hypothetical protein
MESGNSSVISCTQVDTEIIEKAEGETIGTDDTTTETRTHPKDY